MLKYQSQWKSVQWEPSCFMRTDRRSEDTVKLIVTFRKFANAPKNSAFLSYSVLCVSYDSRGEKKSTILPRNINQLISRKEKQQLKNSLSHCKRSSCTDWRASRWRGIKRWRVSHCHFSTLWKKKYFSIISVIFYWKQPLRSTGCSSAPRGD